MATHKVSSTDVQSALAQVGTADETGSSRVDQYVVKEHVSNIQHVSEEEYKKIMGKRREEFIVGKNKMGYDDNGKELWEEENAKQEHRRQELELKLDRETAAKAKGKSIESPTKAVGAPLLAALNNGARAAAASEAPASVNYDQQTKKDLDSMLQSMCGEIEAASLSEPQTSAPSKSNAKRKSGTTGAEGTQGRKKQSKGKAEGEKSIAKDVKIKAEPSDTAATTAVKVKSEVANTNPVVVKAEPASTHDNAVVKKEPESAAKQKIKIEGGTVFKPEAGNGSKGEQLQDWLENTSSNEVKTETPKDTVSVRLQPKLTEDGGLWFFMVDAYEDDRSTPPRVFLFGKVIVGDQFQSCCLVVENLERCLHLLLNLADLDDEDAAKEVASQADKELQNLCPGMKRLRTALKWRNYAFEKSIPQGGGYLPFLKVVYDAAGPGLPGNISGQAFNAVFGQSQSLLERLLLTRRIMGPSWLRLYPKSFQESQARLSFCPVELRITPSSIIVPKKEEDRKLLEDCPASSPPLRLLTLSMQTTQKSAQHGHEPVAVACTMHPNFSPDASDTDSQLKVGLQTWRAVRRFDSRPLPRDSEHLLPKQQVEPFPSEQALFSALLQKIQDFDPDVIACQNAYGFDLDVLASRMSFHKLQFWQKLGRLRRSKDRMPRVDGRQSGGFWLGNSITSGRLVCDLALQAKDLLPKLSSYDLPNLARHQIGVEGLEEIEPERLSRYYDSVATLTDLARKTLDNAMSIGRLVQSLQILPLTRQLTNLAGNTWNASLQNKRAERNEMLLCHEFHRGKFILPDRENAASKKRRMQANFDDAEEVADQPAGPGPRRQKAAYSGGLVLEPKVGLYDEYVMLLDFNSLYPSIIQEHNICFTTVDRPDEEKVKECAGEVELLAQTSLPDGTVDDGILPKVLKRLVSSRQQVKSAMKHERNAKILQTLEIRQRALKLTANSMYGCLGFQNSRFHARPLAALITAKGREALQSTIAVVEQELSLEVVYGDTDSVFVNTKTTDYKDAMQAAQKIKTSVNKRYKKLEIEVDGVFGRLLLLKKKKYAALKVTDVEKKIYEREYKGLDIVRRDWCGIAKEMGQAILDQVLGCEGKEEAVNWIHTYLPDKCAEIDQRKVALDRFVITKALTKLPQEYPDAKSLPHVQVALRLQARGKAIRANQEIEYVICEASAEDSSKASFAARARHLSELALDPTLRVDLDWYKQHQIHPLISRLIGPVEGTDASRIAECLGMDGARFAQSSAKAGPVLDDEMDMYMATLGSDIDALLDRKKRFKGFTSSLGGLKCGKCGTEVTFQQMLQPQVNEATGTDALFRCGSCASEVQPVHAQNALTMQVRSLLRRHNEGWVQSTEEAGLSCTRRAKSGRNLTGERQVLHELEFIENLCSGATTGFTGDDTRGCRKAAMGMRKHAQWLLDVNGCNWVDCGKFFSGIFGPQTL